MTGAGPSIGRDDTNGRAAPVILRGPRADERPGFASYAFELSLPRIRFAIVLAIVLYALFGVLDASVAPDDAAQIWLIRYAIVCPVGVAVLVLSYRPWFSTIAQPTLAFFAGVVGLGVVAMVAVTDPVVGYLYYAGLLLVIPWIATLLQLRPGVVTMTCLVIIAGYEVVAIWLKPTPSEILVSNNFFLLASMVIGMVAGYVIERGARTAFEQRELIDAQRIELAARNAHLDSELRRTLLEVERQADDLRASRARIVVAADVERRRIERNLHDGAQQQLLALAAKLNIAMARVGPDSEQGRFLAQLKDDAQEAVEDIRDLARGIYPPLLADQGLVVAIASQIKKTVCPTELRAELVGRYPSEVETAVYFSILEALQNVVKYANASVAVVSIAASDGTLAFEVRDDGAGFDPDAVPRGIGLQSMEDRLQALGGSLEVRSARGDGTTIRGTVPAERVERPAATTPVGAERASAPTVSSAV